MSDTVEAAIIGAVATVLVAVIGLLAHRRKTIHQSHHVTNEIASTPTTISNASHGAPQTISKRTVDLSHKQIADAITAVPPLQQDSIEASFVGVYVRWRGKLFAASRISDYVHVTLEDVYGEICLFHCKAAPEDCVDLLIAPAGTELIVHGRIQHVGECNTDLEDCKFEMPQAPQSSMAPELQTRVSELERQANLSDAEKFYEKVQKAIGDSKNEQPKK